MAIIRVRSTDGSDTDDGSTWALAKATLESARAAASAGDTIVLSQDHVQAFGASHSDFISQGTLGAPLKIVGVSDAAETPTARGTKPQLTTTTGNIIFTGNVEIDNLYLQVGSGASTNSLVVNQATSTNGMSAARIRDCVLRNVSTGGRPITFGSSAGYGSLVIVDRSEFFLGGAAGGAQSISASKGRIELNDCWLGAGMNTPAALFNIANNQYGPVDLLASGFDCSNMASTLALIKAGSNSIVNAIFRNSKFPSGWNETLFGSGSITPGTKAELHNCTAGSTVIRYLKWDNAGVIRSNETNVRTGGANDGTAYSLRCATNTSTSDVNALLTPELPPVKITSVGSPVTATVEILVDDAVAWTDSDAWIEGVYLANSGDALAKVASGRKDLLAADATLTSSSDTWDTTGLTNPQKRKLTVTFTPQRAGLVHLRVAVAKKSIVAYVDNKITVA